MEEYIEVCPVYFVHQMHKTKRVRLSQPIAKSKHLTAQMRLRQYVPLRACGYTELK